MSLYLKSVGRGANFLLNVPPDTRGLISKNDSASLMAFRELREGFSRTNLSYKKKVTVSAERTGYISKILTDGVQSSHWAPPNEQTTCWVEIDLESARSFNTIIIKEYLKLGQRVQSFVVEVWDGTQYREVTRGTTIGRKRILQFNSQAASKVKLTITASKASPVLSSIELYDAPVY